jgi:uncharacterized membrane protein YesL
VTVIALAPPQTGWQASLTRLADTLLLGALVAATSLGVVTAGPALAAAAIVVRGWQRGDSPPLLATFIATVRAQTRPLLLPQLALAGLLGVVGVDLVAAGHGLPGGAVARAVLVAVGAFAVVSYLAMFSVHAEHGGGWWPAWARAARLCLRRPTLTVGLVAVLLMVALMAGPLTLATSVLVSRA